MTVLIEIDSSCAISRWEFGLRSARRTASSDSGQRPRVRFVSPSAGERQAPLDVVEERSQDARHVLTHRLHRVHRL